MDLTCILITNITSDEEIKKMLSKKIINKLINRQIIEVLFGFLLKMQDNYDINIHPDIIMKDLLQGKMIKILKILLLDFTEAEFQEKRAFSINNYLGVEKLNIGEFDKKPRLLIKLLNKILKDPGEETYQNVIKIIQEDNDKIKAHESIVIPKEIYSNLLKLLIKSYTLFNDKIKEKFLKDVLMLSKFKQNLRLFNETNNFMDILLNNDIDKQSIQSIQLEEIQQNFIEEYIRLALVNEDGLDIIFYLLTYENSKNFVKLLKIVAVIFAIPNKLPDNKAIYINVYQICCLLDDYSFNDYDFYSVITNFYVFLKERKILYSLYPQLKCLPFRIEAKDIISKLSKDNIILQNGGFLLIMIKIMLRYIKRSTNDVQRLHLLSIIKDILTSSSTLLIKESFAKIKNHFKSFDILFNLPSTDKVEDSGDITIVLELVLYKLIKIMQRTQNNTKKDDKTQPGSKDENLLMPSLVDIIAQLIISYGPTYLLVLGGNFNELLIKKPDLKNGRKIINDFSQTENQIVIKKQTMEADIENYISNYNRANSNFSDTKKLIKSSGNLDKIELPKRYEFFQIICNNAQKYKSSRHGSNNINNASINTTLKEKEDAIGIDKREIMNPPLQDDLDTKKIGDLIFKYSNELFEMIVPALYTHYVRHLNPVKI